MVMKSKWKAFSLCAIAVGGWASVSGALAQNLILNGDFEDNVGSGCQFNLVNASFNAIVANAAAFGTANELDVMDDPGNCTYGSSPFSGTTKVGIHSTAVGGNFDAFAFSLSSPMKSGEPYTITFYAQSVLDFDPDAGSVAIGASTSSSGIGTEVFSAASGVGGWTKLSGTFTAPFDADFLTVWQDNGTETWNHIDAFELVQACNGNEKFKFKCKSGTLKIKVKGGNVNGSYNVELDGSTTVTLSTNAKGKGKAKVGGQAPGGHTAEVCGRTFNYNC